MVKTSRICLILNFHAFRPILSIWISKPYSTIMQILAFLRPEAEWSFFLFTKFSSFQKGASLTGQFPKIPLRWRRKVKIEEKKIIACGPTIMFWPKKWFWGGHFKPCPFGVELPNCTFLMELLKIVSLIHAGEDRWAGASAGALSLCYIISSKTKFQRCTVHLAIIGELQVLLLVLLPQLVRGCGCWIATIRCTYSINWILIFEIVHADHWASHFWKFRDFVRKTI